MQVYVKTVLCTTAVGEIEVKQRSKLPLVEVFACLYHRCSPKEVRWNSILKR